MLPLVSIIVPVYNVEKYLQQCVDSLVSQTYQNIEILLIDDGSKDNSGQMCNQFSEQYTNVMSFHKKNSGLGLTRNFGLERINGDYVTFVDSDDYLRQDAIQKLVDGLGDGQNDTVIGGFTKITDDGKELYIETYPEEVINNGLVYSRLFNRMLGSSPDRHDSIKPSVWNALYSVKIIQEHNLHFVSERELISEDIVWDSDYYRYSQSAKIISEPTYYYRYNPNSLSQTYNTDRFEKSIYFYKHMTCKMSNTEIAQEAKLRLIRYLFICVRSAFSQSAIMPFRESQKSIKKMCSNLELQQAIDEYPINRLGFKQRIFIMMVKYKWTFCLTFLSKQNLM
ncbi:glycosyltransferase [Lactobacillus delbrueckii]|uniref:Glycosyltransferase n=1 Tax=Lactobacillus delbrueckii TaxID=1584 RepID=A0A4V2E0Z0_9LACO|nr:glycosyltransferase [Lactobacillus delbrueckii]RZM15635.1 glycosyltransferase [Lactobacillus delbrueckii]